MPVVRVGKSYVVRFTCPSCGEALENPLTDAGKADRCPKCGVPFVTPGVDEKKKAIEAARKAAEEAQRAAQKAAAEEEQKAALAQQEAKERRAIEREYARMDSFRKMRTDMFRKSPKDIKLKGSTSISWISSLLFAFGLFNFMSALGLFFLACLLFVGSNAIGVVAAIGCGSAGLFSATLGVVLIAASSITDVFLDLTTNIQKIANES